MIVKNNIKFQLMMNKRIFIAVVCLLTMTSLLNAQSTEFETATQAVQNMKVGWNLGNTFDSHRIGVSDVTQTETMRGQPVTKVELMEMMKMAGFNAIRVPVTWYPHMDAAGNIDDAWMNRIEEVVNYVLDQDMYCIINMHHDTGKKTDSNTNKGWLKARMANYNKNKAVYENIWRQIANRFKNYGERLIFESFNEMLDTLDSWRFPTYNLLPEYDEAMEEDAYNAINAYNNSFVQTVRATGGKNAYRNLVIKTYAACDARFEGGRNNKPFQKLTMPENSNHLIVGIHTYPNLVDKDASGTSTQRPWSTVKGQVDLIISNVTTYLKNRCNVPVIIGEWGTSNVDAGSGKTDYDLFKPYMFQFVDYFVQTMKANNIATFYWMGLSNQSARSWPRFNQADLAAQIVKAYYGNDYRPMTLTSADYKENGYDVTFTKQWAEINLAKSDNLGTNDLKTDYKAIEVVLNEKPNINGNLSFRVYPSLNNNNTYGNYSNITSITNRLNFDNVSQTPIQRATIVWRSSGQSNLKIRHVLLVRKDGTKEKLAPVDKNASTITSATVPAYIAAKIGKTNHSTLFYGYENLVVPPYVTANAYKVENGKLTNVKTYGEGDIIPKGTGVVLQSTESTVYKFATTNTTGSAATGSMMRGSDEAAQTTGGDKYYMLSLNRDSDPNSVGFYYGKENGAAFTNGAHKAYFAVPANEAKAVAYLFSEADEYGETTGVEIVETGKPESSDNRWYSIDGKPLKSQPAVKGIYIVNGRKVVVK